MRAPREAMKKGTTIGLLALAAFAPGAALVAQQQPVSTVAAETESAVGGAAAAAIVTDEDRARAHIATRIEDDFAALRTLRPGFPFWQHIFLIPDGSIAFGSRTDGRLLATFPSAGDWTRTAHWEDHGLQSLLDGMSLPRDLDERRDEVATLLEPTVGPVQHNPTRGNFLLPKARRYGAFLDEWAAIYERFGVPAEIGLAQAILESGLDGKTRSSAGAIGLCQWLPRNWRRLDSLTDGIIEIQNQTSQAPFCAAYLLVLSTKYGTFIPALSEHHSGGANVGRTVINGSWLGGASTREQYLLGADLAKDLRTLSPRTFSDIYRTYGPRSYLYAEMVFGNTGTVANLRSTITQQQVYGMRTPRAIPMAEITSRTGLSKDEVQRYNPALVKQVPRGATLYLPRYVRDFGSDVSFWHRPADPDYMAVLNDFVRLEATPEDWDSPAFDAVIRGFERRFRSTNSEEGTVMATVLSYVMQERGLNYRMLTEYRNSTRITELFQRGVQLRTDSLHVAPPVPPGK
jgi:hypothetical protein